MKSFPVLRTRRCVLKQTSVADACKIKDIITDVDFKRFMPEFYSTFHTLGSVTELIQTFVYLGQSNNGLMWSVELGEELIGFIGIMDIPIHATLFYATHKKYRNNGYMKECTKECVDFFKRSYPGLNLYSEVFEDNWASLKILSNIDVVTNIRNKNHK